MLDGIMRTKEALPAENALQRPTDCSLCSRADPEFVVTCLVSVLSNVRRPDKCTSLNIHHSFQLFNEASMAHTNFF